jgi:hypothetical protein
MLLVYTALRKVWCIHLGNSVWVMLPKSRISDIPLELVFAVLILVAAAAVSIVIMLNAHSHWLQN